MADGVEGWLTARLGLLLPLLLSLSVHEWAHAWTALRLGDDTAARQGRLTLNPLAHMDPLGTLLLPLLGVPFGWAKPVPILPFRFHTRVSMRAGVALTAAAGPVANLVLALLALLALVSVVAAGLAGVALLRLLETLVLLNLLLAVFNALPFPPLDGSRIVDAIVPSGLRSAWDAFAGLGPVGLVVVILVPTLLGVPLLSWPLEQVQAVLAPVMAAAGR